MAEVIVLIQGHIASEVEDKSDCPTISLIKDHGITMIADPGTLASQDLLMEKLREQGLTAADINLVFLTHSHFDHYKNVGMFTRAKVLEYFGLWGGGVVKPWPEQFSENIRIIKTPGHDYSSLTALVKTKSGLVAVCGDVFWHADAPADDPYASDTEKLAASRKLIVKLADYIVPGHGPMYKVKNNFKIRLG